MKIIIEGEKSILSLWGNQVPKNNTYRIMRYTVFAESDGENLLYNVVTGELVLLSHEETEILKKLPCLPSEASTELIARHFLVPEDYDEQKSVDQLRHILKKMDYSVGITSYTILPTTACNARCFYCYESDFPKTSMTEETSGKIVDYISEHCGPENRVSLHWFGGEPMLGKDRIDQICSGLKDKEIAYKSRMTSNTFLFDENLAKHAKDFWHLYEIQTTLDGTNDIYNKTKSYANDCDNPFEKVMNNIYYLLKEQVRVIIRLNLGFHNTDDLHKLVDVLVAKFKKYENLVIYVGILFDDTGYEKIKYTGSDYEKLTVAKLNLDNKIVAAGIVNRKKNMLPHLERTRCIADNPRCLLISPTGEIGKCEHAVFDRLVGDLSDEELNQQEVAEWEKIHVWPECSSCCLYPKCVMLARCPGAIPCQKRLVESMISACKREMIIQYKNSGDNK